MPHHVSNLIKHLTKLEQVDQLPFSLGEGKRFLLNGARQIVLPGLFILSLVIIQNNVIRTNNVSDYVRYSIM